MKELSKFKVLSITLLVTMSSCVAGAVEINAETLRSYGIELDVNSIDHIQSIQRSKKNKTQGNNKFGFTRLVESGRKHFAFKGLTLDYSPIAVHLSFTHLITPLINKTELVYRQVYKRCYCGANILNRAGPSCIFS
ncbi:hypothetical protein [Plebeiibacterium marinum]|uniref:Uncharacterized protein n=1 Tax=Plebeiibacterium marinum TaxID=2992111 RepID=A0AAE3MBU0_9BACT|nr:hypothetical protein [Plebeiobacterium marinum]MCW3804674.1 hypothetical protein [Plebeiobacterium marinum]